MLASLRRHPCRSLGLALLLLAAGLVGGVNLWAWHAFGAASQALQREQFDEAQRQVDLCSSVWPRSVAVHCLAARIARWRRDYPQAEEHLKACRRLQPEATEEVQLEWLLLRGEEGDREAAQALWRWVANNHPESAEILASLSRTFMRQLQYLQALRCLDTWLERCPDTVRALDWRGWVWEHLQQATKALADYQRVLELSPEREATRLRLAQLQLSRYEGPAARHTLEPLRQSRPNDPEVLLLLARCRALEGKPREAAELLDTVLAAQPDNSATLLVRGDVALQLDQPEQAETFLRRGLAISPDDRDLLHLLHQSLRKQPGREEEADRCLDRYNQVKKDLDRLNGLLRTEAAADNADTASVIGTLLIRLHQEPIGLHWLHHALEIDPLHPASHEALAAFYEQHEDPEQAREHRRLAAASSSPSK
jgi:predicted Zn-dependent protease